LSIAAASVLAKTYRDDIMEEYALQFPAYNWQKNKGYPTKEHRNAILTHGATDLHRQTFTLLSPEQLSLF
jgi:ribonuclease HII